MEQIALQNEASREKRILRRSLHESDQQMEFVVFALESAAQKAQMPTEELYARLEKLGLIQSLLFDCYDTLHTQGRDYIANVVLEAMRNWEEYAGQKEGVE